jgi:alkylation response protein AidB-like acyl-CoA dehydrogenase
VDSRNHARLALSDTPAMRLGEGGASEAIAAALDAGRALLAAEMLGMADEAFNRTIAYLRERKQFDRIIGTFQGLQHRAARLYSRLDIARGIVLKALRAIDEGHADATWIASLSKATMTALTRDVMIEAMQMHGGIGVTDDHDVGLFVKRARVAGELLGDDYFHTERLAAGKWGL